MAYTEYFSTDASAPVADGQAGSIANLLDKILVSGYGSRTALGWAIEYTGTNLRAYRAPSGGTSRMRLRVDDTGAQEARVVGYEAMSDVNTGTGPFPTAAQISGGLFLRKSAAASAITRPWYACGTDKWFYLHIFAGHTTYGNTANTDGTLFFGELDSFLTGDIYNTLLICRPVTGATQDIFPLVSGNGSACVGHYMPRSYVGGIGAVNVGKLLRGAMLTTTPSGWATTGQSTVPYPDPISGQIPLSKIDIVEVVTGGNARRMTMPPEIRAPLMISPASNFDTFSGVGVLAGKNYRLLPSYHTATSIGKFAMEIA